MPRGFAIFWICAVAAAQTGAPAPAFEVASVKRYTPQVNPGIRAVARTDPPRSQFQVSGTRVSTAGNLMRLVAVAFDLEPFQVSQSQEWADKWSTSEVYEIEVTPVYNLVVAPGGPKLQPTVFSADAPRTRTLGSGTEMRTRCLNFSMADLVELVRRQFDHPLLDKTGLTGGFDFSLDYISQIPGMTADVAARLGAPDPEPGIPVVVSIREQLGLRVVPAKEPIEMLVIAHAERPTDN